MGEGYPSENDEILEVNDEMFITQFQQTREKDNEHATSTMRVVLGRKMTKAKKRLIAMIYNLCFYDR